MLKLEAKDDQDENTAKRFARIDRAVTRMSHQIENVLDFVKAKPLDLKKKSFSKVLNLVIDRINIPSKVRIHLPQNDVKITCDFEQLEIVLINLIANAIQAMNNKGEIYIRASDGDGHSLIEVEDSGPGISSKSLPKIFDPLYTTRQIGTGLGLPSCKTIVEKHHGKIEVDTILGKGTTFKITLPKM
ncbi:MAG: putative histidine kinase [Marine Group I thaumarchaeote]|nr:MAG: putative histidine kinase [Marine Group I thaumarchaeote]